MAEIPKVEQQASHQLLKELKAAVATAKREQEAVQAVLDRVREVRQENDFCTAQIQGARGRIFMLLLAQTRQGEVRCADEYLGQLDAALAALSDKKKKAEP